MTSQITPYAFDGAEVRVVVGEDGEPWFVAADVARILGYERPADAVRVHCKGVGETQTPTAGGLQTVKIIPERDVYRLIMRSRLPGAESIRAQRAVLEMLEGEGRVVRVVGGSK